MHWRSLPRVRKTRVLRRLEGAVICPDCGGEGEIEPLNYARSRQALEPIYDEPRECTTCRGEGHVDSEDEGEAAE